MKPGLQAMSSIPGLLNHLNQKIIFFSKEFEVASLLLELNNLKERKPQENHKVIKTFLIFLILFSLR